MKIVYQKRVRRSKDNSSNMYQTLIQIVWTSLKLCWLRQNDIWLWYEFDFCIKFDMLGLCHFFCKHIYLKGDSFKICVRESVKRNMTAHTGRKYNVFLNIWTFQFGLSLKSRILPYPPVCFFCLINSFYRRYVCFLFHSFLL